MNKQKYTENREKGLKQKKPLSIRRQRPEFGVKFRILIPSSRNSFGQLYSKSGYVVNRNDCIVIFFDIDPMLKRPFYKQDSCKEFLWTSVFSRKNVCSAKDVMLSFGQNIVRNTISLRNGISN
jgi:hypothetical protein